MVFELRHLVRIAGRVADAQKSVAIAGAEIRIVNPAALKDRVAVSRADGFFYFLDLPAGDYRLQVRWPAALSRYGTAEVRTSVEGAGPVSRDRMLRIELRATSVRGRIRNGDGKPVCMALVSVRGSGEHAYSNAEGEYLITGIEPGRRDVIAAARGYKTGTGSLKIARPGDTGSLDIGLERRV